MSKNLKIVIGVIAVVILILVLVNIFKDNSTEETSEEEATTSEIKYDEETGEYYIEDEETGEILHSAYNEDDLYIYTIDPDYDPKLPAEDTALMENETENVE